MTSIRLFIYKKQHRSGNVTWVVRWKHPITGQWFNLAAGKTRQEAEAVKVKLWQDLLTGKDPREKSPIDLNITVGALIDRLFQHPRFLNMSEKWKKIVRTQYDQTIRPELGSCKMITLKRDQIIRLYSRLKKDGLAHTTIKKYHQRFSVLGQLFEELNPGHISVMRSVSDFQRLFPKQASTRVIDFLTPDELERVFIELDQRQNYVVSSFIRFLANTGLRRSEALALKWTSLDLENGYLTVEKSKNGNSRRVPLERAALVALQPLSRTTGFIFVNPETGKPFYCDSFLKPLKRAAKRAGITKRIDVHTLRHSYGSNKIRQGWGMKKVSLILGHSDISITSQIYTHLLDGDLKVRDEYAASNSVFSFDKSNSSENSNRRNSISALVRTLDSLPLDSAMRAEFTRLIQSLEDNKGRQEGTTAIDSNRVEKQENAIELRETTTLLKSDLNVPHRFRADANRRRKNVIATVTHESKKARISKNSSLLPRSLTHKNLAIPSGVEPPTFSSGG